MMIAVDFLAAGLVGLAAEAAWRRRAGVARWAAVAGVIAAVVPVLPRPQFHFGRVITPAFFTSRALDALPPGSVVVVAPYPEPDNVATLRWQVASGFRYRMAGGYALVPDGDGRPSFVGPATVTRFALDAIEQGSPASGVMARLDVVLRNELRLSGASAVIVGPMAHEDQAIGLFTALLGRVPVLTGGVALWANLPSLVS
jgi:hypothetical protein